MYIVSSWNHDKWFCACSEKRHIVWFLNVYFLGLVSIIFTTPPEIIVLQLENCHVFADVKVLNTVFLVALSDHLMRIINGLMNLDSDFIFDTNLTSVVGAPSIKNSIRHQGNWEIRAWSNLFNGESLLIPEIFKLINGFRNIAVLDATITWDTILATSPVVEFSLFIKGKIEALTSCNSLDFDIIKVSNSCWCEHIFLVAMT